MLTRTLFPNDGSAYQLVDEVRWDCPRERLPEVTAVLEGAFRAAPEERIAAALFRLRMLTRAREQRSEEVQEAEATIWIEQLLGYPGDVVLEVLNTWTLRLNGQWWPTWHEVQKELQRLCDRRQALLNFVRILAQRPDGKKAIADRMPTAEQRAEGVRHYEVHVRPFLTEREGRKPDENPQAALDRIKSEGWGSVVVSEALAKNLGIEKGDAP